MNILTQILQYTATSLIPEQHSKLSSHKHKQNHPKQYNNSLKIDHTQIQLPINYAQRILQLQMQIQSYNSCNIDIVCQLNQLYMIGIQYYGRMGQKEIWKVQHFTKKLIALFNNVQVHRIIGKKNNSIQGNKDGYNGNQNGIREGLLANAEGENGQKQNAKTIKQEKQIQINPILYTANLKQELSKFTSQSENVIKNIIQINNKKQQRRNRLMTDDLRNQQKSLNKRLEQRLRSRSKRVQHRQITEKSQKKIQFKLNGSQCAKETNKQNVEINTNL